MGVQPNFFNTRPILPEIDGMKGITENLLNFSFWEGRQVELEIANLFWTFRVRESIKSGLKPLEAAKFFKKVNSLLRRRGKKKGRRA